MEAEMGKKYRSKGGNTRDDFLFDRPYDTLCTPEIYFAVGV